MVAFSNIDLTKLEKDQVKLVKAKFYRRFADDVISRRLKNIDCMILILCLKIETIIMKNSSSQMKPIRKSS